MFSGGLGDAALRLDNAAAPVARALAIGIYTSRGIPDFGAFLPLLLTQEGGEGRGEEARLVEIPLSPALSPLVPRGERGNLCRYQWALAGERAREAPGPATTAQICGGLLARPGVCLCPRIHN